MAAILVAGGNANGGGGGGKDGGLWDPNASNTNGSNDGNEAPAKGESQPTSSAGFSAAIDTRGLSGPPEAADATVFSRSPLPEPGAKTTCILCRGHEPRVSRFVTCLGCDTSFHWVCIGYYDHNFQKPQDNWRCKKCEPPTGPTDGESKAAAATAAVATGRAAAAAETGESMRAPESAESIDVGAEGPLETNPFAAMIRAARAEAKAPAIEPAAATAPAPTLAPALSPVPAPTPEALTAVAAAAAAAPSTLTTSTSGERICPVCKKDIGRKRTMDCSLCRTPSHAGCVNVRGAETPKSWVCRECAPSGAMDGGGRGAGELTVVPATPAMGAESVGVSDALTPFVGSCRMCRNYAFGGWVTLGD